MIKSPHLAPTKPKNDHILLSRQLIKIIDSCPHLLRQDKFYLRNKIKTYYKSDQLIPPNEQHPSQQISQLLTIFTQCQQPLNKIHLYQYHYHWLQIKLRKYISTIKKKNNEEHFFDPKKSNHFIRHQRYLNQLGIEQHQSQKNKNYQLSSKRSLSSKLKTKSTKSHYILKTNYLLKNFFTPNQLHNKTNKTNTNSNNNSNKILKTQNYPNQTPTSNRQRFSFKKTSPKLKNTSSKQKNKTDIREYPTGSDQNDGNFNNKIINTPSSQNQIQHDNHCLKSIRNNSELNQYRKYQNFQTYRQNYHNNCIKSNNCTNHATPSHSTDHPTQPHKNYWSSHKQKPNPNPNQNLQTTNSPNNLPKQPPSPNPKSNQQIYYTPTHILEQCRRIIKCSQLQQKIKSSLNKSQKNYNSPSWIQMFHKGENNPPKNKNIFNATQFGKWIQLCKNN